MDNCNCSEPCKVCGCQEEGNSMAKAIAYVKDFIYEDETELRAIKKENGALDITEALRVDLIADNFGISESEYPEFINKCQELLDTQIK